MSESRIIQLKIANIAIGTRIGFYNADHAARLGTSMQADGQHAPIHVKRNGNAAKQRWTLIAGLHRLRGAESIGWTDIEAIQIADASTPEADLRRLELAENLSHRFRRPIERAIMMEAQGRLEEEVDHPGMADETSQARALRVRQTTSATVADVDSWKERTARAFDVSLRSLERHRRIHREIVEAMPDLAQALNEHPLGENLRAMERLASLRLDELHDTRRAAALKLLERDDWQSINDVFEEADIATSTGNRLGFVDKGYPLQG